MQRKCLVLAAVLGLPLVAHAESGYDVGVQNNSPVPGSIISNLLHKYDNAFVLYPYEDNYVLYTYTSNINKTAIESYDWASNARKDELKFQLSLAFPIWRGILGDNSVLAASYTQRAWWQISNSKESSPFRETNYEPQLFVGWATDYSLGDWTLRDVETGLNHESNGRSDPTSRSWNRAYLRLMAENGNMTAEIKPWVRLDTGGGDDDNPDIIRYMGHYRAKLGYKWGESVFSVEGQYNWTSGYGGAQLGWSYPITRNVRFYTQLYSGYGESMIDYNHRQTRIGIGLTLNDVL
ncbi:phospholipase A [Rosenbergiella australiborealis]|uniref:Phospholipase A1 n=1 Tax=Rosenbergiella australiborealis TaxID=1544696 RepID=A0ABS5T5C3_9GAMM|nr:phospholipase A [Rosenbergiella australiborealis]MBT0727541.1 phospholipase A [Rosenbergiella australiborealis]